ncbi:uncharacterized protein LOC100836170 [Brachypodium distachyon]|uniref:B box-type domain-containing protein n=1 Tax=Brachypodium distachyon TaxID=15368 RepID=I1I6E9_BRADI|nr:uncharacterized protein LOC100836170 [Brachypodium distachyon]KQJ97925.1 hypothetical protein BRADI_3g34160v3 [Brachypodium distachyon]|eukprot:XP_003574380.1 uncharacterized protein LOC100836170 [Brachypodium distachyon]
MAIDHESPFKELRLKNRRIMGAGAPEPEEEEDLAAAAEPEEQQWPRWLRPLLSARFFAQCKTHADSHRSRGECNMFCLDCSAATAMAASTAAAAHALCSQCLAEGHRGHHVTQIRRSSYHDVIRVSDIARFMDIAGVQTYVINSARVVFLNERPQQKNNHPGKASGANGGGGGANLCEVCSRSLLDNFRFCSLGCKVAGCSPSSASASSSSLRNATAAGKQSFSPSTPPPPPPPPAAAKRRKGIPHRAPFGNLIVDY